ncbi:ribosome maturation factor RimP [Lutibacter agarilyticus]|uniref:Ribosome maturation factor RimP n=1 Tax=Lutibacter agarilyticus TaxID=1109740 RepID=A0A238X8E6_9FLAO|nr:ribosome assembly cofactor RimP [Lutibacter agarilyticus]SNR54841.1 ribosome maturation factor RimP [Lutibacter agarilyticus]
MNKEKVINLLNNALEENPELFLIELKFLPDNKIYVEVDGDKGISLKECIRINREIEHNLDREEEDFSLEVTSPDVSNPLKVNRQYQKNINRILEVTLKDHTKVEGLLKTVNENSIELEWKAREPKPIGKGKVTVVKNATLLFSTILEAKVKIIF